MIQVPYGQDFLFTVPCIEAGATDYLTSPTLNTGDAKMESFGGESPQVNTTLTAYCIDFTSGSEEPSNGDTIVGATSASTATFMFAYVTSGTWAGGDAAGWMFYKNPSDAFNGAGENIDINGGSSNVLTIPNDGVQGYFGYSGNGSMIVALTATETECQQGVVTFIDQTGTKEWQDQKREFYTYGNANAMYAVDLSDGVRFGLTALPNAAADAAGGLPISDAGGLDLDNRMPAAAAVTNINVVYNTDFATNYNTTRDCWVTNAQDFVGTTAADPFNGRVVAASVTAGVTLANGALTNASLAGNMEIVFETDFASNYDTTNDMWVLNLDEANGIETGFTPREVMRLIASACCGKLSGAATTTNTFRDITDTKDRITATVDSDGNRSAVTLDGT